MYQAKGIPCWGPWDGEAKGQTLSPPESAGLLEMTRHALSF